MAADAAVLANEFPEKSFEGFLTGHCGPRKYCPGLNSTSLQST